MSWSGATEDPRQLFQSGRHFVVNLGVNGVFQCTSSFVSKGLLAWLLWMNLVKAQFQNEETR